MRDLCADDEGIVITQFQRDGVLLLSKPNFRVLLDENCCPIHHQMTSRPRQILTRNCQRVRDSSRPDPSLPLLDPPNLCSLDHTLVKQPLVSSAR